MTSYAASFRLAALVAGLGGVLAVAAPAQARESFSFGYTDGRSGLSLGIDDGSGRYVDDYRGRDGRRGWDRDHRRDRHWDSRARRYVAPPYYYYPPPPVWYAPPPPPPPRYYDYRY